VFFYTCPRTLKNTGQELKFEGGDFEFQNVPSLVKIVFFNTCPRTLKNNGEDIVFQNVFVSGMWHSFGKLRKCGCFRG